MLLSFTVRLVERYFQISGSCVFYKCVSQMYHLSIDAVDVFDNFADVASFMFRILELIF